MKKKCSRFPPYVVFVSLVASLGAFLFGYQTAIISGALLFITNEFGLSVFQQEVLVSSILIGCTIGALSGGVLADLVGRKKTLMLTVILFLIGTFVISSAADFGALMTGRLITGAAIGVASLTVPLYIAEISPPESRGMLVSLNQLMITIGILISFIISYYFAAGKDWRAMFAVAYIPALIQFCGLFFVSETPSWLLSKNSIEGALRVSQRLCIPLPEERVDKDESRGFRSLFDSKIRMPVLIGIGISVFQQITGINTVIYYAPRIFQLAGYSSAETAIFATIWLGVVNLVMTFVGLFLVDRVGRRKLALSGLLGMAVSLAVLGVSFLIHADQVGWIAVASLLAYITFFATGMGIVTWLLISEIYPLAIRGRAMSIATFANWASNYFVSLTFLSMVEYLTVGGAYLFYTAICLLGIWFVREMVPETKGKTFAEIEKFWKN